MYSTSSIYPSQEDTSSCNSCPTVYISPLFYNSSLMVCPLLYTAYRLMWTDQPLTYTWLSCLMARMTTKMAECSLPTTTVCNQHLSICRFRTLPNNSCAARINPPLNSTHAVPHWSLFYLWHRSYLPTVYQYQYWYFLSTTECSTLKSTWMRLSLIPRLLPGNLHSFC